MICVFFGHSDAPMSAKEKVKSAILFLLNEGCKCFYVGNNGSFDILVQAVLKEIESDRGELNYKIVLSRVGEKAKSGEQERTVLPEGQELFLPKFAITKRNDWMMKKATVLVVYLLNSCSRIAKYVDSAKKKGIRIINLAEE